ncbi:hypothetical protein HDK90DRAFT_168421 [Phyllosticta capitalensis]|uniref:Uncharacterized protein n=1 Tax=Phyllosticta capitalensis TaxID=121624 RepID=A0ABR1YUR6_9PEZI
MLFEGIRVCRSLQLYVPHAQIQSAEQATTLDWYSFLSLVGDLRRPTRHRRLSGDASEALATRDSPSRPDHDHTLHYHRLRVRRLQHKNDLWFNQAGHTSPLYDDKAVKGGRAHKAGPHRQLPFFRDVVRSAKHIVFVGLTFSPRNAPSVKLQAKVAKFQSRSCASPASFLVSQPFLLKRELVSPSSSTQCGDLRAAAATR